MAQLDQCCAGDADWFGREDGEQLSFDAEGHRKFMVKQEEQLRKDIAAHAKKGANWYLEDSHERVSPELEGKAERRGCLCLRPRARKDRAMSG